MNRVRIAGRNMEKFLPVFLVLNRTPVGPPCFMRQPISIRWQPGAGISQSCSSILHVDNGQHAVHESRP
jgi:hypothetical protein